MHPSAAATLEHPRAERQSGARDEWLPGDKHLHQHTLGGSEGRGLGESEIRGFAVGIAKYSQRQTILCLPMEFSDECAARMEFHQSNHSITSHLARNTTVEANLLIA
jgi:hypothetical protein